METIHDYTSSAHNVCALQTEDLNDVCTSSFEVDGTGRIQIINTGGSSASEGGMRSSSDDDRGKGDLSKPGEKSGTSNTDDEDSDTFDPIKKSVKEAEKSQDKD